jgi:hypothetical protein
MCLDETRFATITEIQNTANISVLRLKSEIQALITCFKQANDEQEKKEIREKVLLLNGTLKIHEDIAARISSFLDRAITAGYVERRQIIVSEAFEADCREKDIVAIIFEPTRIGEQFPFNVHCLTMNSSMRIVTINTAAQ